MPQTYYSCAPRSPQRVRLGKAPRRQNLFAGQESEPNGGGRDAEVLGRPAGAEEI